MKQLCFGRTFAGIQSGKSYRDYDGINGESTEFDWNIFPGFTTLQLCGKINDLLSDLGQTPETFTRRILLMSMFNDILCEPESVDRAWSSQERKTETSTYDRSGRPDKTSWRIVRKVRLGHEEILLDGTSKSVRNEETLRDRSGRLDDINSQEEARPQHFVIGNDATELELSLESRSFVNRVNEQVRKRQTRISNVTGDGEEHSMTW